MATELVLLRDGEELALLLVEEPEAHLHPQMQERVMDLLKELHAHGSVRNLRDRRSDLYRLELRQQPNAEQRRRGNGERTQRKRPTG